MKVISLPLCLSGSIGSGLCFLVLVFIELTIELLVLYSLYAVFQAFAIRSLRVVRKWPLTVMAVLSDNRKCGNLVIVNALTGCSP